MLSVEHQIVPTWRSEGSLSAAGTEHITAVTSVDRVTMLVLSAATLTLLAGAATSSTPVVCWHGVNDNANRWTVGVTL